jgi:hypothetical protein
MQAAAAQDLPPRNPGVPLPLTAPLEASPLEPGLTRPPLAPVPPYEPPVAAAANPSAPPDACPPSRKWWRFWRREQAATYDCPSDKDRCFAPQPLGASLAAAMSAQVANGDAAQMVLYHYDFCPGEPRLNPRGLVKLSKISQRALCTPFPIVIQSTGIPEVDDVRRQQVLVDLAALPIPIPPERVVVGNPSDRGLDGIDSVLLERRAQGLDNGAALGPGVPPASNVQGNSSQR